MSSRITANAAVSRPIRQPLLFASIRSPLFHVFLKRLHISLSIVLNGAPHENQQFFASASTIPTVPSGSIGALAELPP